MKSLGERSKGPLKDINKSYRDDRTSSKEYPGVLKNERSKETLEEVNTNP